MSALVQNSNPDTTAVLAPPGRKPLYKMLVSAIQTRIESGKLQPGERTPSESDLIAEFRVSATTARRCLDELACSGLVRRVQGKGTFVSAATSPWHTGQQIGLIYNELFGLTELTSAHFLQGIGQALVTRDRHPMLITLSHLQRNENPAAALQEIIRQNKLEGLIIMSPIPFSWIKDVVNADLPVASVNFAYEDIRIPAAVPDTESMVMRLQQRLSELGHRHVVIIRQTLPHQLLEGVCLAAWNVPGDWTVETYPYFGPDQTQNTIDRCLASRQRPTAFVALGYELALRVRHAIKRRGMAIPDDVSLLFCGAAPGPSEIDGELCPMHDIGRSAAQAVLNTIDGESPRKNRIAQFPGKSLIGTTLAQQRCRS